MKKLILLWISALLVLSGCAHSVKTTAEYGYPYSFTNISQGLPEDGMWRQQIALHDMNADGMLDIIVPPPRKAGGRNKPAIFLHNEATSVWKEGTFDFPSLNYGYGGIAVSDLDEDGNPDIVLAVHTGGIMILRNTGEGGFAHVPFHYEFPFSSRAIAVDDLDGDGRTDIVAFAEVVEKHLRYPHVVLLLGMNRGGDKWEVQSVEAGGVTLIAGDSVATGDVNGNAAKDILIAPLTSVKEDRKNVWFNDGKGKFAAYDGDPSGDLYCYVVRAGDIDGDGKDEIVAITENSLAKRSGITIFKWNGAAFSQTAVDFAEMPSAMDVADVDGDNKKEVIVLYRGGIEILKYTGAGWDKIGYQKLPEEDSIGVYDLRAGADGDGSVLVVYNLGNEPSKIWNNGLRAYRVKPAGP